MQPSKGRHKIFVLSGDIWLLIISHSPISPIHNVRYYRVMKYYLEQKSVKKLHMGKLQERISPTFSSLAMAHFNFSSKSLRSLLKGT